MSAVQPEDFTEEERTLWLHFYMTAGIITDPTDITQVRPYKDFFHGEYTDDRTFVVETAPNGKRVHMVWSGEFDRPQNSTRLTVIVENGRLVEKYTNKPVTLVTYLNENLVTRTLTRGDHGAIGRLVRMFGNEDDREKYGPLPPPFQTRLIAENTEGGIWLHQYMTATDIAAQSELAVAERRCLYEIIIPGGMRPYIDIDYLELPRMEDELEAYVERFRVAIEKAVGISSEILVYRSRISNMTKNGVENWTAHLIAKTEVPPATGSGFLFRTPGGMKKFMVEAGLIPTTRKQQEDGDLLGDPAVYNINQRMRFYNAPKRVGEERDFVLTDARGQPLDGVAEDATPFPFVVQYIAAKQINYFDANEDCFDFGVKYGAAVTEPKSDEAFAAECVRLNSYIDRIAKRNLSSVGGAFAAAFRGFESSPRSYRAFYRFFRLMYDHLSHSMKTVNDGGSGVVDPVVLWNRVSKRACRNIDIERFFMEAGTHTHTTFMLPLTITMAELRAWSNVGNRVFQVRNSQVMINQFVDALGRRLINVYVYPGGAAGNRMQLMVDGKILATSKHMVLKLGVSTAPNQAVLTVEASEVSAGTAKLSIAHNVYTLTTTADRFELLFQMVE